MPLHAATIFLSAFLLFLVQPLLAKQILPWFGGAAIVWTLCMVFFQLVLLLGYAYAHWLTTRVSTERQAWVHIALLLASLAFLPIAPDASWKPAGEDNPVLRILALLFATVGLPYFLLSSTSPLVQSWYARANHACTSGLVDESRKYGRPMVAKSSRRMRATGLSPPAGFQPGSGEIGRKARAATRSAAWIHAC